jgi:hypothetical protein
MELELRVYLTTRTDPVEDLDSVQTFDELKTWKKDVKPHALKTLRYNEVSDRLLADLKGYPIHECYGIVAYPGDDLSGANNVGQSLLQFLKNNSGKLEWDLEETGPSATTVAETLEQNRFLFNAAAFWDNFTYCLIYDKELKDGQFEIDLEFVVHTDEDK